MLADLPPSSKCSGLSVDAGALRDDARGVAGAGEADPADARVTDERVAGLLTQSGHDVHDSRRKPRLLQQLAEPEQRARRLFRRLHDHGVARRERGAELGDRNREGRVPRDDQPDDTDRLAEREVEAGGPDLHGVAADLVGGAREVEQHLGACRQVEQRGLDDDATVVACLDLGELVGVRAHHLGEPAKVSRTSERRKRAPTPLEGIAGGG